MAVLRNNTNETLLLNYFATGALFCIVVVTISMLKFLGFRANMTFTNNNKKKESRRNDATPPVSGGVYRVHREEFYGNGNLMDPPKKITPAMVKLPTKQSNPTTSTPLLNAKSAPDVRQPQTNSQAQVTSGLSKSTSTTNVPKNTKQEAPLKDKPNPKINDMQEKGTQKREKQRLEEDKKKEKKQKEEALKIEKEKAAKEAKQKKEREKAEKEQLKREAKMKKKERAPPLPKTPPPTVTSQNQNIPIPPAMPSQNENRPMSKTNPIVMTSNPLVKARPNRGYSTDTMGSSISQSSGPPPYSKLVPNESDNTGNTSFGKPINDQENSWDFISQHRQQMSRPGAIDLQRQKGSTLQYSVGNMPKFDDENDNSEA